MQNTIDITKFTLEQLKAMAYDLIGQLENIQKNLQVLNNEIAKKSQEIKETKPEPSPQG